jgi:acetyl/propionyl-CoA carboxylase alpha subunit
MRHPATELVTGLDLVERQVQAAGGERISSQAGIRLDGHAVEAGSTPRTRDEAS